MRTKSNWRILVEARKDIALVDSLDAIAEAIDAAGHHVVRWRGPQSGRVSYSRFFWDCDIAFLCNATTRRYSPILSHVARRGIGLFFVELGWFPQSGTLQIDSRGINADASWCHEPLLQPGRTLLPVRPDGDLLVLLQHEQDTQITRQSPYFPDMSTFLEYLAENSALPLRVRAHPRFPPGPKVAALMRRRGLTWDHSRSLEESLAGCRALACVNSSGAVAALAAQLPVLCFGRAIYRQQGAVYCLDDDRTALARVTRELAAGQCWLFRERVAAMLQRILTHQFKPDDLSVLLAPLLDAAFRQRQQPRTSGPLSWRDCVRSASTWWSTYLRPKLQGAA